jgi:hypothetical protein
MSFIIRGHSVKGVFGFVRCKKRRITKKFKNYIFGSEVMIFAGIFFLRMFIVNSMSFAMLFGKKTRLSS